MMASAAVLSQRYVDGDYLHSNPDWHAADSPWKAEQICRMLERNAMRPRTVCEVGCGVGRILDSLYSRLPGDVEFAGYDIAPEAIAGAKELEKPRLRFHLGDFLDGDASYDLVLTMDVVEHVEDYYGFLRRLAPRGRHHIFHFPLEVNALASLRSGKYLHSRHKVGHIHYFSKDTAVAALLDTGYDVLDWFYTPAVNLRRRTLRSKALQVPRRFTFRFAPDLAVRMLGGYPLLILARPKEG